MRIVFAGTPEFAATALASIIAAAPAAQWRIPLVLTLPDRPAGRGLKLAPSPVKALAIAHGIATAEPSTLGLGKGGAQAAAGHELLRQVQPDVLVVAAYGLMLPQAVLDIPRGLPDAGAGRLTAINIHGSLLPRWRGAAPIARALEAGDRETGITIMQIDAGLDTGPMLAAQSLPISDDDTTASLTTRLAALGAQMIVSALHAAAAGHLQARLQPAHGVTYAHKLDKREAWLDWTRPAVELARRVRAFDPFPGAAGNVRGTVIRIWRAEAVLRTAAAAPGTIVRVDAGGIEVSCGEGALIVRELQRPGGRRLAAAEFLNGMRLAAGDVFAAAPAASAA